MLCSSSCFAIFLKTLGCAVQAVAPRARICDPRCVKVRQVLTLLMVESVIPNHCMAPMPHFDETERGSIQQGKLADLRLPFLVSEETPKAFGDDLRNLKWHQFFPGTGEGMRK